MLSVLLNDDDHWFKSIMGRELHCLITKPTSLAFYLFCGVFLGVVCVCGGGGGGGCARACVCAGGGGVPTSSIISKLFCTRLYFFKHFQLLIYFKINIHVLNSC